MRNKGLKNKITKFLAVFILGMVSITCVSENEVKAAELTGATTGNEYAYLFKDGGYVMYDLTKDKQVDGYPKPVNNSTWPGLSWTTIDTAFTNPVDKRYGYIFKGNQYVKYDFSRDRAVEGFPAPINDRYWPGLPFSSVDAVVPSSNGKVFFIKGNQYARYDMYKDSCDPGYPKALNSSTWPGLPWTTIDSAVPMANNICYLIKGDEYVKYDLNADKVIQGVKKLKGNWPNLAYTSGFKGALTVGVKPANENFIKPHPGSISSKYGPRTYPYAGFHTGIDIAGGSGTPIVASKSGRVITATYHSSYGNYIIIDHGNGYQTLYAHASKLNVSVGQSVSQGQVVALVGSTGNSTGPHVHFEIRINGNHTNPLNYI